MFDELERLRAARKIVVRIVQTREDGAKFLPIILELERHIAAATNLGGELTRIMNERA